MNNSPKRLRRRRFFRIVMWTSAALLLIVAVTAIVLWTLWTMEPAYWQPPRTGVQAEQQALALENRLPTQLNYVRDPNEPWELTLTQDEVNAWLDTRLDAWLTNQRQWLMKRDLPPHLPSEIEQVMVAITPRKFSLAAKVNYNDITQILSADFRPTPAPGSGGDSGTGPGKAVRIQLIGLKGGRLPIPPGMLDPLIQKFGSQENAESHLIARFRDELAATDLIVPLVDKQRVVRVERITLADGYATLTCRTISAKSD